MRKYRMTSSILGIALLLAAPGAIAAPADTPAGAPEVRIPYANKDGIRSWRVVDSDTVYIEGTHQRWYRAELMKPCFDLPYAEAIGFETRGNDDFDRFSAIRVGRQRCPVESLVAVPGPPPKKAKKAKGS